ncbi:MAG: zf-HC2 domain-containing protein [Pyrinomonadaceae bacterium]|nr:zf-HC2 domain-containing protein [Phycisphaerales bacterium]
MISPSDMTCRELIDFIMEYTEGALAAPQREEFERHLSACPSCMNYLSSYAQTIQLGKAAFAPADQPTQGPVPESLRKAIKAARAQGM